MAGALAAALLLCSNSYAATFGHARIVSAPGKPLGIDVPISDLTPDDLRTLSVSAAPASQWTQAGLLPPVDIASLHVRVVDGFKSGAKVIQLRSTEPFQRAVADVLLDVRTASGQQRYQVSLLAQGERQAVQSAVADASGAYGAVTRSSARGAAPVQRAAIIVKRGDTMFAIARRNAVPGVTIYQMMIALQRANPHAFIHKNLNLVKAGAKLVMPDMAALTAISDHEARRLFMQQAHAFALYRQRAAAGASAVATEGSASSGVLSAATPETLVEPSPQTRDELRLSGTPDGSKVASATGGVGGGGSGVPGSTGGAGAAVSGSTAAGGSAAISGTAPANASSDQAADAATATRKGIDESEQRVSQLEENVKNLNKALQAQGEAAKNAVIDGAIGLSQTLGQGSTGAENAGAVSDAGADAAKGSPEGGNATASDVSPAVNKGNPNPSATGAGDSADAPLPAGGMVAAGESAPKNVDGTSGSAGGNTAGVMASRAPEAGGPPTEAAPASSSSSSSSSSSLPAGGEAAAANQQSGAAVGGATPGASAGANGSVGQRSDVTPQSAQSAQSAQTAQSGQSVQTGQAGQAGSPAQIAGSGPTTQKAAPSKSLNSGSAAGQTEGSGASGKAAAPTSKAGQFVSWIQEHTLGMITGALALIVLIIAWLLRRANAVRDDDADGGSGLITEAMVQKKLDQINLDLSQDPLDSAASTGAMQNARPDPIRGNQG